MVDTSGLYNQKKKKEEIKRGEPLPSESEDEIEFQKQQDKIRKLESQLKNMDLDHNGEINRLTEECGKTEMVLDQANSYIKSLEEQLKTKPSKLVFDTEFIDAFLKWIKQQNAADYELGRQVIPQVKDYNRNGRITSVLALLAKYMKELQ